MTKELERMLDRIDDFLADSSAEDAVDLWSILTALRGPDGGGDLDTEHLKAKTTAVIRRIAFPRAAGSFDGSGSGMHYNRIGVLVSDGSLDLSLVLLGQPAHFGNHIRGAEQALTGRRLLTGRSLPPSRRENRN